VREKVYFSPLRKMKRMEINYYNKRERERTNKIIIAYNETKMATIKPNETFERGYLCFRRAKSGRTNH